MRDHSAVWSFGGRMRRAENNRMEFDVLNGPKKNPPVTPPPEPEKKHPPIGPPKRDPKPEPIKDPLYPPSPGTDPKKEPEPIGDPPDDSDQPIRMGFMTTVCPVEWPADYSPYRDRVSIYTRSHHMICDPLDSLERSSV